MPRYFFNIHDVEPSIDTEGFDLPSDEAAWITATKFAGAVFVESDGQYRPGQEWTVEVLNEARKPLYFIVISSRKMAGSRLS